MTDSIHPHATRRTLLKGVLAVLSTLALGLAPALAQELRIGRIVVDTSVLRERGIGPEVRAIIERTIRADLGRSLGARLAPRAGTTLVVNVTSITMSAYTGPNGGGGRSSFGDGGGDNDYMDGVTTLIGPRREAIASYPMLNALPSSSGGAWFGADAEARRVQALSKHYAYWLMRKIAG